MGSRTGEREKDACVSRTPQLEDFVEVVLAGLCKCLSTYMFMYLSYIYLYMYKYKCVTTPEPLLAYRKQYSE